LYGLDSKIVHIPFLQRKIAAACVMDWYFEYEYLKKCCWFNYRRSGRVTI